MKDYTNEKYFVEKLINFDENRIKASQYIKENLNVDSEYDETTDTMYIWSNESENLDKARDHMLEQLGEDFIDIIYGRRLV